MPDTNYSLRLAAEAYGYLSNRVTLLVRECVRKYYDCWLICDDDSCGRRTMQQSSSGESPHCSKHQCVVSVVRVLYVCGVCCPRTVCVWCLLSDVCGVRCPMCAVSVVCVLPESCVAGAHLHR